MGISLNYTTVDPAESKDDWEIIDNAQNIDDSPYPPRQGSECIHYEVPPNDHGGIRNINDADPFDCSMYEVGVWFLNPVVDKDNKKVVANVEDGIYVRLYSSNGNYANYYQPQHRHPDGEWKGGWLYLRASGLPGEEDSNSGTWELDDVQNTVKVAVYVNTGDGDTTDKDSGKFGVDWSKYYNAIEITGDNDGEPWTLEDIYNTDIDIDSGGGIWGVVEKTLGYYSIGASLVYGDGTNGKFTTLNEYVSLSHKTDTPIFNITVLKDFEFTSGIKTISEDNEYFSDGSIFNTNNDSTIQLNDEAIVKIYDSILNNFSNILLGESDTIDIDISSTDMCDSTNICIQADGVNLLDNRLYFTTDKIKDIGKIDKVPSKLDKITVFNANNSFIVNIDTTFTNYKTLNNNYDLLVKDGVTTTVIESVIDNDKLKRVE